MAREATSGFELNSVAADGWVEGTTPIAVTDIRRLDRFGNGGAYVLRQVNSGTPVRMRLLRTNMRSLTECWIRCCFYATGTTTASSAPVIAWFNGTTELGSARWDVSTGQIRIYTGTGTLVATSGVEVFPRDTYFVAEVHVRIKDTGGLIEVFIDDDGTYSSPTLSFSGDTKPGADTTITYPGIASVTLDRCEDFAWNSVTMQYDNEASGPFVAGETITGGTSGATAVITSVEDAGTTGVLVLQQWNGTDFQNNETITGGTSSCTAQVNAPTAAFDHGFEPNSWGVGPGRIILHTPTSNGTTTQLDGSDGNSTDNYLLIDEIPPNSSDYVVSGVADEFDTYGLSNLPSNVDSVACIESIHYSAKDGTGIENAQHVVRVNGTNYFSENYSLGSGFAYNRKTFNVSPDTSDVWTTTEINALEAGFRVRA